MASQLPAYFKAAGKVELDKELLKLWQIVLFDDFNWFISGLDQFFRTEVFNFFVSLLFMEMY